jgi:hypothetical protein
VPAPRSSSAGHGDLRRHDGLDPATSRIRASARRARSCASCLAAATQVLARELLEAQRTMCGSPAGAAPPGRDSSSVADDGSPRSTAVRARSDQARPAPHRRGPDGTARSPRPAATAALASCPRPSGRSRVSIRARARGRGRRRGR